MSASLRMYPSKDEPGARGSTSSPRAGERSQERGKAGHAPTFKRPPRLTRQGVYIVDKVAPAYLGEFEHLLLLAVLRLGADAYAADVAHEF